MTQWSRQPGIRIVWHAVVKIEPRPEQPNPALIYAVCGRRFPETLTAASVPDDEVLAQCPKCLQKAGG